MTSNFGSSFAGGALGGAFGNVIAQAVIEVVVDNGGIEKSLTNTQKLLGATAVAGFGAATIAAVTYETAMAGVQKTTGATGEELAVLSQQFRDMATSDIPMSASALAGLGATAAQLGVEVENLEAFTATVAKLGTATNIVGEQGAQDLARFINVSGETTAAANQIGSAIVDLGNNSATTEAEILAMALRTASAGRQLGLTTGDTLGLATAMSSLGLRAEAGGTAASRVILDIFAASQKGGDALSDYAKVAGVTVEQYQAMVENSPMEALTAFIGGMATAEDRGINLIAMLDEMSLGDVRVRDTLLRLAGAQELVTDSVRRGNEAYAEGTALEKEFGVFAETTANQARLLLNQLIDIGIGVGSTTLPVLNDLVGGLRSVLGAFSDLPGPVKQLTGVLVALITLGPVFNVMLARSAAGALSFADSLRLIGMEARAANFGAIAKFIGPAGVAGAIAAVGIVTDAVLQKTTGHGLIDWLFRDPQTADAAAASVKKVRDEIAALERARLPVDQLKLYSQEIQRQAELWAEARRQSALADVDKTLNVPRVLKETNAAIEENITALLELAKTGEMSFGDIRKFVNSLDPEVRALVEANEAYADTVAAVARAHDVADFERHVENYQRTTGAVEELGNATRSGAGDAAAFAEELLDLNPRLLATAMAAQLMAAGIRQGGGEYRGFIAGLANQVAEAYQQVSELEGIANDIMRNAGMDLGGGASSGGGGGAASTPLGRMAAGFDTFADRAPAALSKVRAELALYRAAAQQAGDTTAVGLIDRMLSLNPTVSDISGAIRSLQAQYGDLAADAEKAGDIQKRAAELAEEAWEKHADAVRDQVDFLGDALTTALKRRYDEQLRLSVSGLDDQREAARESYDQQLSDLRAFTDARLGVLQGELDALDEANFQDELADINERIAVAWDPAVLDDLFNERTRLLRRRRADEIRDSMRDVEDEHDQKAKALEGSLDDQLADLDDAEQRARDLYAQNTEDFRLQAEARALILSGNLADMVSLLEAYYPEWKTAGLSMSDQLMDGLRQGIDAALPSILSRLSGLGVSVGGGVSAGDEALRGQYLQRIATAIASGSPGFTVDALRRNYEQQWGEPSPLEGGAYITQPTFALLGETARARPEIVAPQAMMEASFAKVLDNRSSHDPSVAIDMRGAHFNGTPEETAREIRRVLIDALQDEYRTHGFGDGR